MILYRRRWMYEACQSIQVFVGAYVRTHRTFIRIFTGPRSKISKKYIRGPFGPVFRPCILFVGAIMRRCWYRHAQMWPLRPFSAQSPHHARPCLVRCCPLCAGCSQPAATRLHGSPCASLANPHPPRAPQCRQRCLGVSLAFQLDNKKTPFHWA